MTGPCTFFFSRRAHFDPVINIVDVTGRSALMVCAQSGSVECAQVRGSVVFFFLSLVMLCTWHVSYIMMCFARFVEVLCLYFIMLCTWHVSYRMMCFARFVGASVFYYILHVIY